MFSSCLSCLSCPWFQLKIQNSMTLGFHPLSITPKTSPWALRWLQSDGDLWIGVVSQQPAQFAVGTPNLATSSAGWEGFSMMKFPPLPIHGRNKNPMSDISCI